MGKDAKKQGHQLAGSNCCITYLPSYLGTNHLKYLSPLTRMIIAVRQFFNKFKLSFFSVQLQYNNNGNDWFTPEKRIEEKRNNSCGE